MKLYVKKNGKFLELKSLSGNMKFDKYEEFNKSGQESEVGDSVTMEFEEIDIPFEIKITK